MPFMFAWLFDGDSTLVFLRLTAVAIALGALGTLAVGLVIL